MMSKNETDEMDSISNPSIPIVSNMLSASFGSASNNLLFSTASNCFSNGTS